MNTRVAAVAFAASALIAAPAFADHGKPKVRTSAAVTVDLGNAQLTLAGGNLITSYRGYNGGYHHNPRNERQKRRIAKRACRSAVERAGYNIGFHDVDFEGVERVRKIGPNGYLVHAEFEFEGRRREFERDITCEVRRGRVVDIDGLPRRRGHRGNAGYGHGYGHGYGNYGYSNSAYMTNYGGLRNGYNRYGYNVSIDRFGFGDWNGRKHYRDYDAHDWNRYDDRHDGHDHERGEICKIY